MTCPAVANELYITINYRGLMRLCVCACTFACQHNCCVRTQCVILIRLSHFVEVAQKCTVCKSLLEIADNTFSSKKILLVHRRRAMVCKLPPFSCSPFLFSFLLLTSYSASFFNSLIHTSVL